MKINIKLMRKQGFNSLCLNDIKKKIKIINSKKKFKIINSCPICNSKKKKNLKLIIHSQLGILKKKK